VLLVKNRTIVPRPCPEHGRRHHVQLGQVPRGRAQEEGQDVGGQLQPGNSGVGQRPGLSDSDWPMFEQGLMFLSQFSAIFANFRRKNWRKYF
jgi:hypothetical protein